MDQYHEVIEGKVSRGTGAKKIKNKDKTLSHVGGEFVKTKIGNPLRKKKRGRGGTQKIKVRYDMYVNVSKDGKTKKLKIIRVIESNNADLTRQSIITKGSIVETEEGKVRITSRPGQDGVLNGIFV